MEMTVTSRNAVRRWGAGTAAIARLLIACDTPLTGVAIAAAVGVTQPRASQVLRQFTEQQAVRATEDGYVGLPERLLDLYRQRARPLLAQPESNWYSTRPALDQARRITQLVTERNTRVAFSADLGPDLLVPWRHPTLTIVYLGDGLDLKEAGLVPAEGRPDATIIVRWTKDTTLLTANPAWPVEVDDIPLADPVQQWADLFDLGGEDRHEAAGRLRTAIVNRTIASSP
jgi:hypothetical protein